MNDEDSNSSKVIVKHTSNIHTQLLKTPIHQILNDSLGEDIDQQQTGAEQQAQGMKPECPEGVIKTPNSNIANKIDFWEKWGKISAKKPLILGGGNNDKKAKSLVIPNKLNKIKHTPNKFKRESKTKTPIKSKTGVKCKLTQTQLDWQIRGIKKEELKCSIGPKLCLKQDETTDGSSKQIG